jgi:hypothetical protein
MAGSLLHLLEPVLLYGVYSPPASTVSCATRAGVAFEQADAPVRRRPAASLILLSTAQRGAKPGGTVAHACPATAFA